jgi:putative phosphonate metabolism protein
VTERFALYYAPRAEEGIATAANQWFGMTPKGARNRQQLAVPGVSHERLAEIMDDPRLYGFHGTLKAPIALVDGMSERDFVDAVGRFAASQRAFTVPSMVLAEIGSFLALVPDRRCPELHDLADHCVVEFDEYRRPADETELSRRRASGLSPRQDQLLLRWGYPYVLEEWRFHLTLTARIADATERAAVMAALRKRFSGFIDRPLHVRDLCIFRQPDAGRPFTAAARFRLGGGRLVSTEVWRAS